MLWPALVLLPLASLLLALPGWIIFLLSTLWHEDLQHVFFKFMTSSESSLEIAEVTAYVICAA
jgi:hypothetical protein